MDHVCSNTALSVLFDILGTHNSIVHLREKMCEKRIKYNHEKGRRISLLYLLALPPQIPLPGPPIGLPLLRYLAHFPHLISKAKTAKIQESMKRGDTRLDILWSILDQNCALFNIKFCFILFWKNDIYCKFLVQEWTIVGRTSDQHNDKTTWHSRPWWWDSSIVKLQEIGSMHEYTSSKRLFKY